MGQKEAHIATATKCLTKVLKINMGGKNLFNNCADKTGYHNHKQNEIRSIPLIQHKNPFKMKQKP